MISCYLYSAKSTSCVHYVPPDVPCHFMSLCLTEVVSYTLFQFKPFLSSNRLWRDKIINGKNFCDFVQERTSSSVFRHLKFDRKIGPLSIRFVPSSQTVLNSDRLIFQDQKRFPIDVSGNMLEAQEPFGKVLNVARLWEHGLKRYWTWQ